MAEGPLRSPSVRLAGKLPHGRRAGGSDASTGDRLNENKGRRLPEDLEVEKEPARVPEPFDVVCV